MKRLVATGSKVSLLKESALDEGMPGWRTRLRTVEENTYLVGTTCDPLNVVSCCEEPFKLREGNVAATFIVCTERARMPVAGFIGQNILFDEIVDLLLRRGPSA